MNDMTAGHRAFKKDLVPVKYINGYQIYIKLLLSLFMAYQINIQQICWKEGFTP